MKIVICGSVIFSKEILEAKEDLEKNGHQVDIPYVTIKYKNNELDLVKYKRQKEKQGDIKYRQSVKTDMIKRYYGLIKESDAILVLNYDKNKTKNYVGGSVLMEMAFAYVLDKPIFLVNPIPKMSYSDELIDMNPTILNGDLSKIK